MNPVPASWSERTTGSTAPRWPTSDLRIFLAVILPTNQARPTARAMAVLGGVVAWLVNDPWTALLML